MPHYLYHCSNCSVYRSTNHSVTEDPEVLCPSCNQLMSRKPQAPGLEFKGTGWGKD